MFVTMHTYRGLGFRGKIPVCRRTSSATTNCLLTNYSGRTQTARHRTASHVRFHTEIDGFTSFLNVYKYFITEIMTDTQ